MKKLQTRLMAAFTEHMEGSAVQKLSLFEKLQAAGMLDREEPANVELTGNSLRALAAAEKLRA
jgi:hypothetical protein